MSESATAYDPSAPDPVDAHLGAKLRELRLWRRLSREALGDALDVSHQQVAKYETGENRISAATLYRAAKTLGIKPEWFFEGLDLASEGARPLVLDNVARKLLDAFDRIDNDAVRKLVASFVDGLARGVAYPNIPARGGLAAHSTDEGKNVISIEGHRAPEGEAP